MTSTLRDDVRGPAFAELLAVFLPHAATVGLVDSGDYQGAHTVRLVAALDSRRIATHESRSWPGSLVPDRAPALLVHTFRYDREVARTLYSHCPALLG